jgi:hypothetical protein
MHYLCPRMKSLFLTIILFFVLMPQVLAWQLRGVVTDESGEPLSYASVYLQNTTTGVLTNIKGEYFIELQDGSYTLVFSSMGYEKKVVEIKIEGKSMVLDITLLSSDVGIDTVVVTASRRDPAYDIMEKVIANKQENSRQFKTYIRETYLKASLEVQLEQKENKDSLATDSLAIDSLGSDSLIHDSLAPVLIAPLPSQDSADKPVRLGFKDGPYDGPRIWRYGPKDGPGIHPDSSYKLGKGLKKDERRKLNLIESLSTTYYEAPNTFKSVISAYRDLSDKPEGGSTVSIGEDGVDVASYQTTTSNPYLFYLDPTDAQFNFYDNLITILRLSDQPFISPLSSTAWRLTYKYRLVESFMQNGRVIHRIEVSPRNSQGQVFEGDLFIVEGQWAIQSVNLQIKRGALNYFRDFRMLHDYTLGQDMRWTLQREEYYYMVKDGKELYYGNTIALHKNYQLDVVHPKGLFRNELRRTEKEAFERDSAYWETNRPMTLKAAEVEFIHVQDSIRAYRASPEYLHEVDSTYNHLSVWDFLLTGVGYRSRSKGMEFFAMPLIAQVQPWGVGGYRHMFGGSVSKTFKHFHKLTLEGEADYGFANQDVKGYARLSFTYNPKRFSRAYFKAGDRYATVTSTTSLVGLFARNNYVRKTYFGAGHTMEVLNGLYWDIEWDFADRSPIDGLNFDNDIFGQISDPLAFSLYREFLITTRIRWVPFQKYNSEPYRKVIVGSKWPVFEFMYKKGLPGVFGSVINFDWVELRVSDEFRPGTFGVSRWAVVAGSFIQEANLRFNDYKFFRGSTPYLFTNPLQDFQNLDTTYSTTGQYLQGNYVHDDAGSIISKIPLLKHTPLQLTGGAAALFVPERDLLHMELFAGVTLPFRIKTQRFKMGLFYASSFSNSSNTANAISGQWKIGITFYDNWLNKWNW